MQFSPDGYVIIKHKLYVTTCVLCFVKFLNDYAVFFLYDTPVVFLFLFCIFLQLFFPLKPRKGPFVT